MSSRQKARLLQSRESNPISLPIEDVDGEDFSEDNSARKPITSYYLSSSDSSTSDEDIEKVEQLTTKVLKVAEKPKKKSMKLREDDEFNDLIVEAAENKVDVVNHNFTLTTSTLDVLRVNSKDLDIDIIMRQRFGVQADIDDHDIVIPGAPQKGKKKSRPPKKRSSQSHVRKFIFGMPREDWMKPPHFIAGGMGMTKISSNEREKVFTFEWSKDFLKLNEEYVQVQDSGDPNRLVLFLSQHPYHPEGFLQLGMVFARTGQMDRAAEMVRRCLYCLECASLESFKPYEADCRLDHRSVENTVYYSALFRHIQMSNMLVSNLAQVHGLIDEYLLRDVLPLAHR